MQNALSVRRVALIAALVWDVDGAPLAKVVVDVRCPDATIEYSIRKAARDAVSANAAHALVDDAAQAVVIVRLSAAPVRQAGTGDEAPLGIALGFLVMKLSATAGWEVTKFQASFVPLDDVSATTRQLVADAIR